MEHQKSDKMIFQQPEHSICTKKYLYHSLNNMGVNLHPWIPFLQQNSKISIPSPRKNPKLPQNINVFSTTWLLHTYHGITGAFMIWNENYGIWSDFNHFCFLALENGSVAKVVKFQQKNIFLIISVLNQI